MNSKQLRKLSNDELIAQLRRACADANAVTVRIVYHLIETEERRIYLEEACPSMFDYCISRLGMSEGEAYLRLAASRLVQRFPSLALRIERGELNLSTLARLRKHLTAENFEELSTAVRGMSKRRVMEFLAARDSQGGAPPPPGPAKLRKLPKIKMANAIEPTVEREIEAVAEMQYRLGLTLDREERDELLYVRDLMMHRNPSGDLKAVIMRAVRELRIKLEREIHATTARPPKKEATKAPSSAKSDDVPPHVRRAVFERDGHRCTYRSKNGERCPATARLELDHAVSPLHGGTNDVENVRVRCRPHNQWHAENVFGKDYVRAKIHSTQLKSRERKTRARASNGATVGSD